MANGIKSEYENIKATDVFEFWTIFDLWEEKMQRETEAIKSRIPRK